jgi:hypothetical protein
VENATFYDLLHERNANVSLLYVQDRKAPAEIRGSSSPQAGASRDSHNNDPQRSPSLFFSAAQPFTPRTILR